jgi:5-methylcytosine-specific restriction protein A
VPCSTTRGRAGCRGEGHGAGLLVLVVRGAESAVPYPWRGRAGCRGEGVPLVRGPGARRDGDPGAWGAAVRPRPLRPCATRGCPEVVPSKHCARHTRAYEVTRGTASQRGYTYGWSSYSKARLAEHPFCTVCGRVGAVTDHIVPARRDPARFWDRSNHQTLCADCNRRKGITEEGGFGTRGRSAR